jgi:hypothetical protein
MISLMRAIEQEAADCRQQIEEWPSLPDSLIV